MFKINPSGLRILGEMLKEPHKKYAASDISGVPYTTAHYGMEELAKKDILIKRKSAKLISYSINYNSLSAIRLAILYENSKTESLLDKKQALKNSIEDMMKLSSGMLSDYIISIIIFGSYAKGRETRESDVDILFAIRGGTKTSYQKWLAEIREICRRVSERHAIKISPFILTVSDFREGLAKNQAIETEIYKNHIIIYGAEFYVKGVFEWLQTKEVS